MSMARRCSRRSNSSFAEHGGAWAGDILPLGSVDYSQALTNAEAFHPNVLINLMAGEDQVNSLTQIASFGLAQNMAVGGALFELETILSVPDAARTGWWTMEWWWNQPDVPAHQDVRRRYPQPHRQGRERAQLVRLRRYSHAGADRQSGKIARCGRPRPRAAGIHVARGYRARSQPRIFPQCRP